MVRPHTRIVVCSRCSAVKRRGTSSNHCLAFSIGRPRRLRSSISKSLSCCSIVSSDISSSAPPLPLLSLVVLIVVLLGPHHVESRGALALGPVSLFCRRPLRDLRVERLHFDIE